MWFGNHFSTRKPSFIFEPYLDRYSAKRNQPMKITRLIAAITVSAGIVLGPAALAPKETRKGKEGYDAVVNRDGKEMAIRVDANGKFLGTHPEKAEKKAKSEKY